MSQDENLKQANEQSRNAWDQNARFWDEKMGDGNHFVEVLIWPATERLLELKPGERVLDIACGNGLTSRRMSASGAHVVGIDFSHQMIEQARKRPSPPTGGRIEYHNVDCTDYSALLALGEASFDAALCNMALFDMAGIDVLMRALSKLLRPGGRFVFSVLHPCFNNQHAVHVAELENREKEVVTVYSIKVRRYMSSTIQTGIAISGQPVAHPFFHRSLTTLLGSGFAAGLVLDGFEERAFPPEKSGSSEPLGWSGNFSEIPPILVARMRNP